MPYSVNPSAPQSNDNVLTLYGEASPASGVQTFLSPIGGAVPVFPSDEGELLYLFSTDAADVGKVKVTGLDENFQMQTELVTLDGQNPVASALLFTRINLTEWYDAGGAVGVIDTTDATGVPVFSRITPDAQRSTDGVVSVPAGYNCQVLKVHGSLLKSANAQDGVFMNLYSVIPGQQPQRRFRFAALSNGSSHFNYNNAVPKSLEGHFDLFVTVEANGNGLDVLARVSTFIEKKL